MLENEVESIDSVTGNERIEINRLYRVALKVVEAESIEI